MSGSTNVMWQRSRVTRADREKQHGHRGVLLWFTGLSGAGKSTLAHAVEEHLLGQGRHAYVLDGDNLRHGLCADLGFGDADRRENIRRVGEVGKLLVDAGFIAIAALISPFRVDRDRVRERLSEGDFIEIHCRCDLALCEARDVKGLYAKARAGEIKNFTGIDSPYEVPLHAELVVDTSRPIAEGVAQVLDFLQLRGVLNNGAR